MHFDALQVGEFPHLGDAGRFFADAPFAFRLTALHDLITDYGVFPADCAHFCHHVTFRPSRAQNLVILARSAFYKQIHVRVVTAVKNPELLRDSPVTLSSEHLLKEPEFMRQQDQAPTRRGDTRKLT